MIAYTQDLYTLFTSDKYRPDWFDDQDRRELADRNLDDGGSADDELTKFDC